jgi:glycolate oxidase FAD binding subunit
LLTPFAIDGVRPGASVAPASEDEVSAVIKLANQHKLSVTVSGGFTAQNIGATPTGIDILLRTERLNRVLHYDPGDLTVGVGAGMRVADVQHLVSEQKLMLPLDVPRSIQATIGGSLATASAGPLKHGYGGVREYCIGVSFVTGDGRIAKAGGRVVKNVAGYDLMKLMIASHGTLGVIVSANFKLFTAPRQTSTFLAHFADLKDALAFRNRVQCSPVSPMCLEIISPLAHSYVGGAEQGAWTIAVRAGGSDSVLGRVRSELGSSIAQSLQGDDESMFWKTIQDFSESTVGQHHNALLMSLHLQQSEVAAALASAEAIARDHNLLFACVGRAAIANLILALIPITVDPPSVMQYANAISAIRGALPSDAAAIILRCPREVKDHINVWGSSTNDLNAMRAVKHALDPNDILNRGRFLF